MGRENLKGVGGEEKRGQNLKNNNKKKNLKKETICMKQKLIEPKGEGHIFTNVGRV